MWNDVRATWALLVGIGFMMLGNGLQGTLLGLRATIAGFDTFITGIMMSGYFVGIFIGSVLAPRLVARVGHIRVFAALASTASIAILIHGVYVDPVTWTIMRLCTGISYAGLYVVTESWLNDRAGNENRGKMLSIYMVITTLGLGCGQFLLNVFDPEGAKLFILVSVVVSFGLIPMLLTARPAPAFEMSSKMNLRRLFKASPLAVISNALTGVAHGTIFGMGAVYARQKGLSVEDVSIFMACFLFGGLLFQWPLGLLSDRIERRRVMAGMAATAVVLTLLAVIVTPGSTLFFTLIALIGGMAMPMYSLCIAYANDRLEPEEIVGASASLVMVAGIGLSAGPIMVSYLMSAFGPNFYFTGIGGAFAFIFLFAVYRMGQRAGVDVEDQVPTLVVGQIGTPVAEICATDAVDYVEAVISDEVERLDEQAQAPDYDVEKRL